MKSLLKCVGALCAFAAFAQSPVTITTTSPLPTATVGASYSVQLNASGGVSPYSWSANTSLPPGLSLSQSGLISGTPTQTGSASVSITVRDAERLPQSATVRFQLTVQTAPLTITSPATLPNGSPGAAYSFNFAASGGTPPYTWSVYTGSLPAGLTLSNSGLLSGAVAAAGQYSFVVALADSTPTSAAPAFVTQRENLTIGQGTQQPPSSLTITTPSALPNGSVGANYSVTFAASGGVTPYYWTAPSLPPGLALSSDGVLSGTPTASSTYSFTIQVTDSTKANAPLSASQTFTLRTTAALTVTTPTPLAGTVGSPLDIVMTASGGVLPEIWQVPSGTQLPPGLTLDTISGFLQGTPTTVGTFTFTVQVSDKAGNSATKSLVMNVAPAISITTASALPAASAGVNYTTTFAATGGNTPYSWKLDSGALPGGLTLDPVAGVLSGTPAAGSYSFTVRVTDSANATLTKAFTLSVNQAGPGVQVSTTNLDFTALSGGDAPSPQTVALISTGTQPAQFTIQLDGGSAGIAAPAWLLVKLLKGSTPAQIQVAVDQTGLQPQKYTARILINASDGKQYIVNVTLTVIATPAQLEVAPAYLRLTSTPTVPAGGRTLYVRNSGGAGSFPFQATVTQGGDWLSVTPGGGQATPNAPVALRVQVNPQGLAVGAVRGTIRIDSDYGSITVPVSLIVRNAGPVIGLDGQGVQFRDRAANGDSQFEDLHILNLGDGLVNWKADLISGGKWLSLGATSGQVGPADANLLRLTVATGGLDPAAYYALVRISDPNAQNSPQYFTVVLNVLSSDKPPLPWPVPQGLIFVARAGATPPPQMIKVYTSSSTPVAYQVAANISSGGNWLSVTPTSGVTATQPPAEVSVAVNTAGLTPGIYTAVVTFSLSSAAIQSTNITLIVQPPAPAGTSSLKERDAVAGCSPSKLAVTSTGLNNSFASPAGWPTPLAVVLSDDCGSAVPNGQVVVTFTNGDPALALKLSDPNTATYSGTWAPGNVASAVTLTARGSAPNLASASADIGGSVTANKVPVLAANGTLNNLRPVVGAPIAPGTVAQVFGSSLAPRQAQPGVVPVPNTFDGTQVLVGAFAAPLYFLSDGQLNVQIPTELAPDREYPVIVTANGGLTLPDTITTTAVDPGLATSADSSAIAQHADFSLITPGSPAAAGESITLYLVGMGATNPAVATGAGSPSSPLASAVAPPIVTIGGQQATILFAGLTPGAVGLYQINVTVPAGAKSGQQPLVITQGSVTANMATLPVK